MKSIKSFLCMLLAGTAAVFIHRPASADDFVWTGQRYIPIPIKMGSDFILTMPEPFSHNFELPSANQILPWDDTSILIRPNMPDQEQRLFLKGLKTGKTYLARVSSKLDYVPIRRVVDGTPVAQEANRVQAGVTMTSLMRAMMLTDGIPPPGFDSQRSAKVLLDSPPFKVVASEVWSSPSMVGIIATISSTVPNAVIPIVPTNIQIRIPEFGSLRMMGADFWEVSPAYPAARVYFVYSR